MGSSPSPAAVLDSRHSGAPELNHSPRVRDGDGDGDGEGGGGGERERAFRGQFGTSVVTLSREVT